MTRLVGNNAGSTESDCAINTMALCCFKSGSNLIGQTALVTGNAASIVVSLQLTGAGRVLQCALYNSGAASISLLGYTYEKIFNGSETGPTIFPMAAQSPVVALTAGAQYIIAVWSGGGAIDINGSDNGSTTNLYNVLSQPYVTYGWPQLISGTSLAHNDFLNAWVSDNGGAVWAI